MIAQASTTSIDVKMRMSALWIVVVLSMLFADILSFISPGFLQEVMTGSAGSVRITPGLLLVFAVLLEIPIAMVFLARVLGYRANRWANILASIVTIVFTVAGGSTKPHYIFFAAVEVACMVLIIRYAWTWRSPSTR